MPEEIVRGKSLEKIRDEMAQKLSCNPEELIIEVLDKPGVLSRSWRVKVIWEGQERKSESSEKNESIAETIISQIVEENNRFIIIPAESIKTIIPSRSGEVLCNGEKQDTSFLPQVGDKIEFIPEAEPGQFTWNLEIRFQGLSAVAQVINRKAGRYVLPAEIISDSCLELDRYLKWEDALTEGEVWDKARLENDLRESKIVHGIREELWPEILAIQGKGEVVVAEAALPVPPQPAKLEDFVGEPQSLTANGSEQKIDFFASKVPLIEEGAVLARKIPGVEGVPGKDVHGRTLAVGPVKDFQFRLKKNVRLSEDGLEVIATCPGQPRRLDYTTYEVDNVYVLHKDVDLETGSIEFPGDVYISGNVLDGLHIYASGKVEVHGSVSWAEIKAEKGAKVTQNMIGGKLVVGEKHVVRSQILKNVRNLHEELSLCLAQTEELMKVPAAARLKPGQVLKQILERNFIDLPKYAVNAENYILSQQDELITEDLKISVKTAKHFLNGLGPLNSQSLLFLNKVNKAFAILVENIALEVPENLECSVDYVQGVTIESGGRFTCNKGVYNSVIKAENDLKIFGVCRGGKIICSGNVTINELGGSEVSSTFVQVLGNKRLKVDYCHPNVIIAIDKEIIRIEEAYKKLEIYRESGLVQVEKLRADPL